MHSFDSVAEMLTSHSSRTQILIAIANNGETLEKAILLLESISKGPITYKYVQKEDPIFVIISILGDVRQASALLTENGFKKIKGISPSRKRTIRGSN